jgi:Reverse transcriptase (RNA-dependent DNA polymerase)
MLSDHFPLIHFLSADEAKQNKSKIQTRDYSDRNISNFNNALSALSWTDVTQENNPQIAINKFYDTFHLFMDLCIPRVTKTFNRNFQKIEPWMTAGILNSRRTKLSLEKGHFSNPSADSLDRYKRFRNLYNKTVKLAKKMYFERELKEHQSDAKKSWSLIKTALRKSNAKNSCILSLSVNNVTLTDPFDIANHFNEFFTSVAQKIVDEINPTDRPPDNLFNNDNDNDIPLFSFSNSPVTHAEIIQATKLLQPKMTLDMDGLSIWLVQKIILAIAISLQHIFFESFRQGSVPSQFKIAKIVPVFKTGAKDCMDNYRPISLLNSLSKIMEQIVYNRLSSFLEDNNIISNFQFGFRKAHSTLHPLI